MEYDVVLEKTIKFAYDEDIEIHFTITKSDTQIKYILIGIDTTLTKLDNLDNFDYVLIGKKHNVICRYFGILLNGTNNLLPMIYKEKIEYKFRFVKYDALKIKNKFTFDLSNDKILVLDFGTIQKKFNYEYSYDHYIDVMGELPTCVNCPNRYKYLANQSCYDKIYEKIRHVIFDQPLEHYNFIKFPNLYSVSVNYRDLTPFSYFRNICELRMKINSNVTWNINMLIYILTINNNLDMLRIECELLNNNDNNFFTCLFLQIISHKTLTRLSLNVYNQTFSNKYHTYGNKLIDELIENNTKISTIHLEGNYFFLDVNVFKKILTHTTFYEFHNYNYHNAIHIESLELLKIIKSTKYITRFFGIIYTNELSCLDLMNLYYYDETIHSLIKSIRVSDGSVSKQIRNYSYNASVYNKTLSSRSSIYHD